jgi:hypothetical protein
MIIKVVSMDYGHPMFDKPIHHLFNECVVGSVLQVLSPLAYISYQQIKWWKGVLLPALSKDSGDSIDWWETTLKMAVMPDEFEPKAVIIKGVGYTMIPSITKLSVKKMNQLIEGSVAKLRDEMGKDWVTLPDSELRK